MFETSLVTLESVAKKNYKEEFNRSTRGNFQ